MSGAWRQVPRYLNILLSVLNLALFAAGFYFVASRGFTPGPGWTPVELVTAVLAALAILITVLGIFLAILAFWGYTGELLHDFSPNLRASACVCRVKGGRARGTVSP
jgi:hypothetical protein